MAWGRCRFRGGDHQGFQLPFQVARGLFRKVKIGLKVDSLRATLVKDRQGMDNFHLTFAIWPRKGAMDSAICQSPYVPDGQGQPTLAPFSEQFSLGLLHYEERDQDFTSLEDVSLSLELPNVAGSPVGISLFPFTNLPPQVFLEQFQDVLVAIDSINGGSPVFIGLEGVLSGYRDAEMSLTIKKSCEVRDRVTTNHRLSLHHSSAGCQG